MKRTRRKKYMAVLLAAAMTVSGAGYAVWMPQEVQAEAVNADFEIRDGVLVKYHGAGGEVIIPDGVTSIGDHAFSECSSLTGITLPDGILNIEWEAFHNCTGLTHINIPDSVTSIGEEAFYHCTSLTNISIPESVVNFGGHAFLFTPWLEERREENSVIVINHVVIDGREVEGKAVIPDGVTKIGDSAFSQ